MNARDDRFGPVVRALRKEAAKHPAPVIDLLAAQTRDPLKVLVGTLLSARTQDATTAGAVSRLFARAGTLEELRALPEEEIARQIFPVGFYRVKAHNVKALAEAIASVFRGEVPRTIEELCTLPGVGRKTANLVLAQAFGIPAICVDVHVHRISNRLGLVETATPFDTEMALRASLPKRYWIEWNSLLVGFGQTRCRPVRPRCDGCPLRARCPSGGHRDEP